MFFFWCFIVSVVGVTSCVGRSREQRKRAPPSRGLPSKWRKASSLKKLVLTALLVRIGFGRLLLHAMSRPITLASPAHAAPKLDATFVEQLASAAAAASRVRTLSFKRKTARPPRAACSVRRSADAGAGRRFSQTRRSTSVQSTPCCARHASRRSRKRAPRRTRVVRCVCLAGFPFYICCDRLIDCRADNVTLESLCRRLRESATLRSFSWRASAKEILSRVATCLLLSTVCFVFACLALADENCISSVQFAALVDSLSASVSLTSIDVSGWLTRLVASRA